MIAILVIVMVAGIGVGSGSPAASRRTAVDLISAMADRARTTAIATRKPVVMVLAAPSDLPAGEDRRCRVGLFQVESEENSGSEVDRTVIPLGRWKPMPHGISWGTGPVDGAVNPWGSQRLALQTDRGSLRLHGIIFTSRGGISSPSGSAPAAILIGEVGRHAADTGVPETLLHVGRNTGRIYQMDR